MEILISTDGTITNTKLTVDGKEITSSDKVVEMYMRASAPFKSKYSGDMIGGNVGVTYSIVDDKGVIKTISLGTNDTTYAKGVGEIVKQDDQVIRYVGQKSAIEVEKLVDKIVQHCATNNILCKDREVLLSRSVESLKDTATDFGIKLEDTNG